MSARPRRPAGGFGYAIDYDRAIAEDLETLEDAERCLARGIVKPATVPAGYAFGLLDAALAGGAWLARLEITDADRHDLAWYLELGDARCLELGIPLTEPEGNWYRRAAALDERLSKITAWASDLRTETELKKWRAKAKADLARHRRNKTKYGIG